MNKPDWQEAFRDFPRIPEFKKWVDGHDLTREQEVTFKLLHKQEITEAEVNKLANTKAFYTELASKLNNFDYKNLTEADKANFINYIRYAFNYHVQATNKIKLMTVYRSVVNECVLGTNQRITNISYLKHPSLDIVKKIGKYNRANSMDTHLFYCSENIDTTLKEIRPTPNKLVTVGVWEPIDEERFLVTAITHSDTAAKVNEGVKNAKKVFEELRNYNHELFIDYIGNFQAMLGHEFTKKVEDHREYLVSAVFSESLLRDRHKKDNFSVVGILYPSVGNGYATDNFAILPEVADARLRLHKVLEFEIEEPFYDKDYVLDHHGKITLARVKNMHVTTEIKADGTIVWP